MVLIRDFFALSIGICIVCSTFSLSSAQVLQNDTSTSTEESATSSAHVQEQAPQEKSTDINTKKYSYIRSFIERGIATGTATFIIPQDILKAVDSLDEIVVYNETTRKILPTTLITSESKPAGHALSPRETHAEPGKIVHMIPLGSVTRTPLIRVEPETTRPQRGSVSVFYTPVNIGLEFSDWRLLARDVPVSLHMSHQGIIRSSNTLDIGDMVKRHVHIDGFEYDPQLMIVYKSIDAPESMTLTAFPIEATPHTIPIYGYPEREPETLVYDIGQSAVEHSRITFTIQHKAYASYVTIWTSPDKNQWTKRGTDVVWAEESAYTKEKSYATYAPTRDRFIKVTFSAPLRVHPIATFGYSPISMRIAFKEPMDMKDIRVAYGVPDIYKPKENQKSRVELVSDDETVSTITLAPERPNPDFVDVSRQEEKTIERISGIARIYGETAVIGLISALVLMLITLVIFKR